MKKNNVANGKKNLLGIKMVRWNIMNNNSKKQIILIVNNIGRKKLWIMMSRKKKLWITTVRENYE